MSRNDGRTLHQIIGGWLTDLHIACTNSNVPIEERKAKVAALTGALALDFPDPAVFTRESLHALAKRNNFFPSFSVLSEQLSDWWEAHRPKHFCVPLELDHAEMPAEARANVIAWLKHASANDLPRKDMVLRLSIIRRCAPAGYRWLINNDNAAAEIAVTQRWSEPEHRQAAPTAEEIEAVHQAVRSRLGRPEDFGDAASTLAPDQAVGARAQADPTHSLGALSREQLHAMRMANPALRVVEERQTAAEARAKLAAQAHPALAGAFHAPWHDEC
jgi:hypothetical protein